MAKDFDLGDSLGFLESEGKNMELRPEVSGKTSGFVASLAGGACVSAVVVVVAVFLSMKGIVQFPGLQSLDAPGASATPPAPGPPRRALPPAGPPPKAFAPVVRRPQARAFPVDQAPTPPPAMARPSSEEEAPTPEKSSDSDPGSEKRQPPRDERLSPEEVLRRRGLSRSGIYFVVESESDVLAYLKRMAPSINQMDQLAARMNEIVQLQAETQALDDRRIELFGERNDVDLKLPLMSRRTLIDRQLYAQALQYRAQLNLELNAVITELNLRLKRLATPQEIGALQDEFKKWRGIFLEAAKDLRPLHDKTRKEYDELKDEQAVKDALAEQRRLTKAHVSLGPSKEYQNGIGMVRKAEQFFSPETFIPSGRKKKKTLKGKSAAMPVQKKG